jgi:2-oxoglutarate ferredoxin oxidoreductase subunit alpha
MFALGMVYCIFDRPMDYTEKFLNTKFIKKPEVAEANKKVLKSGFNYAVTIHAMPSYRVQSAESIKKGNYRNMNGNTATAWGLLAAAEKANVPFFLGSYPITPASEILAEISIRKDLGAKSFQAEDEIGGIVTALGASFVGHLAATSTSGPGLALKTEAIGLAVITELPLVIVDVQRGGPSTGLPTKTEQADLFQAIFGRNGECPVPVIAASTPSNCFNYAYEAAKIALEHMTPVVLLTDGFLANGTEPWKIVSMSDMPPIKTKIKLQNSGDYLPYKRDVETLVREWAIPGTPGYEHRIGGLEKMDVTGTVSYVPENHQVMSILRRDKVEKLADVYPEIQVEGNPDSEILVIGWGSTYGHLTTAVRELNLEGYKVAHAHFNHIFPLPKNTAEVFSKYKKRLVCEINLGQFASYLQMKLPKFDYSRYNKIQGLPFTVVELKNSIKETLQK